MTDNIPYIGAAEIRSLLTPARAVHAVTDALTTGLDPAADPARIRTDLRHGQFLLMPSDIGASAGVKVATVAPDNPSAGLPRIQAVYLLFDSKTLTPRVVLDGTSLTAIRTPAVSVAAVLPALRRSSTPARIVVFGGGPQAVGHVETLSAVLDGHREIVSTTFVVRRPESYRHLADGPCDVVVAGSAEETLAVAAADVVVCATTATTPLFDSDMVRNDAVVIAVGSHEANVREVDANLCRRAQVIVEDVDAALRECGDVVLAIAEGALRPDDLIAMRDVVSGQRELTANAPVFFKGAGMSWQDLVVAEAVTARFAAHAR